MGNSHDTHTPVEVDPKIVQDAEALWGNFMKLSQYTVIGVVVILLGMAIFLL